MNETSLDRKLARCAREIEAAKPKGLSFDDFRFLNHDIKGAAQASRKAAEVETTRPLPVAAPPSAKFAVGQRWKRRDGKEVLIEKLDDSTVPVKGDDQLWRLPSGVSYDSCPKWDLTELLSPPEPKAEDTRVWRHKAANFYIRLADNHNGAEVSLTQTGGWRMASHNWTEEDMFVDGIELVKP